jgi:peptidoglycan/LPS O-acetylase OafA/YrhL
MGIPMHDGIPVGLIEWSHAVAGPYDTKLTQLIILCMRMVIAIGLASLSWLLVERPLSRLRKRIGTSDKSDSRSELRTIPDGARATSTLR